MDTNAIQDRFAITDTLQNYAVCIDTLDFEGLRRVFTDDSWSQYTTHEPFVGAQALIDFMAQRVGDVLWQQHAVNVVSIVIDGDTAETLAYFHAHAVQASAPDTVVANVGEYRDRLRRTPDGWRIFERRQKTGWKEFRSRESK